jgi:cytochrome c5
MGDAAAWAPHIKEGLPTLVKNATNGIRAMPPRGGDATLTDAEVQRAVVYLANLAGAKFKEPAAPKEAAKPAAAAADGKAVYDKVCFACHASGVAGAPKLGDKAAWAPRIKQGLNGLLASATKGKGSMPPKGGDVSLSDDELSRAIVYMANQSGAKFKEPAAPKAAPAAAQPAAAAAAPQAAASAAPDGKKVFDTTCTACHTAGIAGAPKLGDKAAWAPRIKTGIDALMQSALKGKGAMPPKGGNAALSDAEVRAAIEFMISQAK